MKESKMDVKEWITRYENSIMNTFGTPKTVLTRGAGCFVWDEDGHQYLDLLGGIAVNALGHGHPNIVTALHEQVETLGHVSNYFATQPQIEAAERILSIIEPGGAPQGSRVFFTNSGTEALEAAFKLARARGGAARSRFLALENSFHGRTMGALSLTYKSIFRDPFLPMPAEVDFLPYNIAALERAFDGERGESIAALFIEPIQGEAGVRPISDDFLKVAREVTARAGALLVLDEVQTGMGRTGTWMAHHPSGIIPDVVTLAKGLGAGFPVGACVALNAEAASVLKPGMHGSTFAGNPLAGASVLAMINTVEEEGLLSNVQNVGDIWKREILELEHPLISEVRGRGLLLGIGLRNPLAKPLADELFKAGFIVNAPDTFTIRLAPPLIINPSQTRMFTQALPEILDQVQHQADQEIRLGGSRV